ncbi:MAG TPA: nuclear transport factor 2 family protein [Acidimicrobiia bacterium]|nr:nuclear transport factor 2 family protein [Acidimicrobiia bacterium]
MPDSDLQDLLADHIDAWNRHDLESLMSLFAEDCVFEASGGEEVCGTRFEGYREVKEAFAAVFESMPDAQWTSGRHYSLAPDYGVSEWTLIGTLRDGRRLEVNGCDFLTVRDGRVVRKNSYRKQRSPI